MILIYSWSLTFFELYLDLIKIYLYFN